MNRCIGSDMARIQLAVAFGELFARITNVRLADGEEITYATGHVHGPARLPLVFDHAEGRTGRAAFAGERR